MAPRVASRWVLVVGTILVIATVSAATTMLFMGTASPLMRSHSSSKRENQQQHRRQMQPSAAPPSPPLPSQSRTPVTATAPALQQQHTDLPPPPPPAVAVAPVPIFAHTWQQVQSLVQRLPDAPPLDVAPAVLASDRGFSDAYNFHSRNSDPEFGVRELVLGNEPPGPFMVNPAYTTGVSDDRAVARHYAALQRGGHPKLQRPPQNKDTGWQENFLTACTSVQQSFEGTNPRRTSLREVYQSYWQYNTRACPVMTPECLQFLDEAFLSGANCMALYRKCCVEHRRLKLMVEWMVDMFERTNNTSTIAYHIRAGGLLGIVRDGGVLMGTDSDVDVAIDPLAYEQLPVSMKVARRPKWLIFRKPEDHTLGAPSKHRWVVHFPAWPSFATFHDADTHLELYYGESEQTAAFDEMNRTRDAKGPFLRCKWYGQGAVVQVGADWTNLAKRDFKKFKNIRLMQQHRTPNIHGMYGLHWCGPVGTCCGEDGQPLAPRGYDAAGPIDV